MKRFATFVLGISLFLSQPIYPQGKNIEGVTPLSSIDDSLTDAELEPLVKPLFQERGILGIAENVHGSKQILQMESRLVRYAVEKENVRHLFLEQGLFVAQNLNQYVQTCEGDVTSLVKAAAWWAVDDEIKLMQWLCNFNLQHPNDKVQIHGVDIYNFASMDHHWLLEKIQNTDLYEPTKAILDKSVGKCIGFGKNYHDYKIEFYSYYEKKALIDPINFVECEKLLHQLQNLLQQTPGGIKKLTALDMAEVRTYVRNLDAVQNYWLSRTVFNDDFERLYRYRDSAMATNVIELWNTLGKPKSLFMAHVSHASKQPAPFYKNWKNALIPTAGSYISKTLGNAYKVIGFTGYDTDGTQGDYIVPVANDSLDKVLHTLHLNYAWLDVTHYEKFNRNWWVQNENGETETEYPNGVLLNPSKSYDAMIYIDRSEVAEICD